MTDVELEGRIVALAQMAAMLEAGDRAAVTSNTSGYHTRKFLEDDPAYYANRAAALFDAAEEHLCLYGTKPRSAEETPDD